jgi:hypothetical protein
MRFIPRQEVTKKIVDAQHSEVTALRYECKKCAGAFRVYPDGVSEKRISKRVNGMAIMLYVLGLSYGAVEIVLSSLGMSIGKTSVYRVVQSAAEKVPGLASACRPKPSGKKLLVGRAIRGSALGEMGGRTAPLRTMLFTIMKAIFPIIA